MSMRPFFLKYIKPLLLVGVVAALVPLRYVAASGGADDVEKVVTSASGGTFPDKKSAMVGEAGSYLAARHARELGDADAASYFYSHSLSHDPYDENLMKQAVRAHVLAGKVEDAAQVAKSLTNLYGGTQISHLVLLASNLRGGDIKMARKELDKIDSYGLFSVVQPVLGGWVAFAETGKPQEIAISEHIKRLQVFDPFLAFQNALIFDLGGDVENARKFYTQATQDMGGMSYRNLLTVIGFYHRQGDEKQARALFDRYAAENHASQVAEGVEYEDALKDSQREDGKPFVANAAEGAAEALLAMAGMLYGENVVMETQLYLRLALYLRPVMPDGLLMLGAISEDIGKTKQALQCYDAIPASGPVYRRGQVRKVFLLVNEGNTQSALNILDDLKRKYAKSPDVLVTQGDVYRKELKFGKAADAYTAALNLSGDKVEAYQWPVLFARGISYERDGEWDKAEKDFRKALELYPDQPDVLNYLGYSWLMQGTNLEKAKELLEQAVAERPEDAHIIDSMGWAFYLLGDYKSALEYLEQAINLMPGDPVVNDHYGDVLWRVGRKTEARYQWERALYFGPEEEERDKIKKKLEVGLGEGQEVPRISAARN